MASVAEGLNDVIQQALNQDDEGAILTGWTLCFEIMSEDGRPMAGFFMGPVTTPWKALGLMSWAEKLVEMKHIQE